MDEFYEYSTTPIHTPANFDSEVEDAISYLREKKIGREIPPEIVDRLNKLIEILFATQNLYHSEVRYSSLIEKKLRTKCDELRICKKDANNNFSNSEELEKVFAIFLNICSIAKNGELLPMYFIL